LEIHEVQNSWNGQEPATQLPRAELNPLTNTTLGQNLGRWAQVYFTTPPGQREQAVGRLLRELENENRVMASPAAKPRIEGNRAKIEENRAKQSASVPNWLPHTVCPACQHSNRGDQRFCGSCGSPLQATRPETEDAFVYNPTPENVATAHPESDVQWLREKALASLDGADTPHSHAWIYLVACVIVLLAGVGYLQWASQRHRPAATTASAGRSSMPEPVNTPQPRVEVDQPQPAGTQKPAEIAPAAGKSPTVQTALATRENINKKPVATSLGSSAQSAGSQAASVPPSEATAEAEGGAEELRLAERYLEGKSGARDTTEAGKWLEGRGQKEFHRRRVARGLIHPW
jgi:hypothetical protein